MSGPRHPFRTGPTTATAQGTVAQVPRFPPDHRMVAPHELLRRLPGHTGHRLRAGEASCAFRRSAPAIETATRFLLRDPTILRDRLALRVRIAPSVPLPADNPLPESQAVDRGSPADAMVPQVSWRCGTVAPGLSPQRGDDLNPFRPSSPVGRGSRSLKRQSRKDPPRIRQECPFHPGSTGRYPMGTDLVAGFHARIPHDSWMASTRPGGVVHGPQERLRDRGMPPMMGPQRRNRRSGRSGPGTAGVDGNGSQNFDHRASGLRCIEKAGSLSGAARGAAARFLVHAGSFEPTGFRLPPCCNADSPPADSSIRESGRRLRSSVANVPE